MQHSYLIRAARIRRAASLVLSGALVIVAGAVFASNPKGVITRVPGEITTTTQTISSAGPLDSIFLGVDAATQISHVGDSSYQVYPPSTTPGDYGTFIVVGNDLYAPDFAGHGTSATVSIGTYTAFTPISQSAIGGSGTSAAPYTVTTMVGVGATGLTLTHVDTYVVGQEDYRTDVTLTNTSGAAVDALLYRAMDCFLGGADSGYGFVNGTAVGCSLTANNSPADRIEQLVPLNGGNAYYQAGYDEVWAAIGTHAPFDNTCRCNDDIDNGAGISWNVTVPANGSITRSHLTVFSPLGAEALFVTKTADQPAADAGGTDGYTIVVANPNVVAATLDSIIDTLPAGFTYQQGSSSGTTTADPVIAGQVLTWTGSFPVPANGTLSLHFNVTVSSVEGTYYNQATATGAGLTIAGSGPTAPVTIGNGPPPPPPQAAVPTPTLGGGMLALLALLMVGAGVYFARRSATR